MAYSIDLRKRCVDYYTSGHSKTETAKVFQVGTGTVSRWRAELRDKGMWGNIYKSDSRQPKKLKFEALKKYVEKHPDAFLYEIAAEFSASSEGVRNALKRYGITRKKRLIFMKNGTKKNVQNIKKRWKKSTKTR